MAKFRIFLILLLVAFVGAGCENIEIPFLKSKPKVTAAQPPAGAVVVAKVGSFYVTKDDLNKWVDIYNARASFLGIPKIENKDRDKKVEYLREQVVSYYLLYQEALDRGLDRKEDLARTLEINKVDFLVTELQREEMEKIEVTSREIDDFYNKNKELLKEPEQRKIAEIVTKSEEEAKQVYIELLKGGDFASLAKQYSKAPTATNGGDLGFIRLELDPKKRIRSDKFYEVAFSPSLETGGYSSIFKGPDGHYIIKLEETKKSEAKSLTELSDKIKSFLLFEKQQKAIANLADKLKGETKWEIYEGKVE